jgi:hypothetical protein
MNLGGSGQALYTNFARRFANTPIGRADNWNLGLPIAARY